MMNDFACGKNGCMFSLRRYSTFHNSNDVMKLLSDS